jgi:hypothetical protein
LIARHEREIFPLLQKRYLFSGVDEFALYDFVAEGGGVDEDVFAYSNRAGDEKGLVLYNNKFKSTRGRIHHALVTGRPIGEALGLSAGHGDWLVFRDATAGLEYIRPLREVTDGGFFWELQAFKYAVLMDFRPVHATRERPYGDLAADLSGRGVPSIERAVVQHYYRPIHAPLREALTPGHLAYVATYTPDSRVAFEEKLQHLADGLAWMLGKPKTELDASKVIARATERWKVLVGPSSTRVTTDSDVLLAWLYAEGALDLLAEAGPTLSRAALIDAWAIPLALTDALGEERATRVLLALTTPEGDLREIMHAALSDPRGRAFMNVHESGGVVWLVKERFDELARLLAEREAILDRSTLDEAKKRAEELSRTAEAEGFRAEAIAAALAPASKSKAKPPSSVPPRASRPPSSVPPPKRHTSTTPPAKRKTASKPPKKD